MRAMGFTAFVLAVVVLVGGCGEARTYKPEEVRRAFAAEGIRLDPPDFDVGDQGTQGPRLLATLSDASGMGVVEVDVFEEADAYERLRGALRDLGTGDVLGRSNLVVVGPVRGSAPHVEAALDRLP